MNQGQTGGATPASDVTTKACCAQIYSSDWTRLLLGASFHPGGLALTSRLAERLSITAKDRVLDVAAGRGTSAIHLARAVGCHVVGIDLSRDNVAAAVDAATGAGVDHLCTFLVGDAEGIEQQGASFDVIICECAFCTFPKKHAAAAEFARLLRSGGRVGLTDVTRSGPLRSELDDLLAWVACVADAEPADRYVERLHDAGLEVESTESHDQALVDMVATIRSRLAVGQTLAVLKQCDAPGWNFDQARVIARCVTAEIRAGRLGYVLLTARKA
jgi:SAM-dependent methyltransferase